MEAFGRLFSIWTGPILLTAEGGNSRIYLPVVLVSRAVLPYSIGQTDRISVLDWLEILMLAIGG